MFFSRRSMQAEYFDAERPEGELCEFYRALNAVNRRFGFAHPFKHWVPTLLQGKACDKLEILDVGAGDGTLGLSLRQWAADRQWDWTITNLDLSVAALRLNPGNLNVAGSALALPFRDGSFDVVIASQMAHHLADVEVERLLRETSRVARQAVIVSDLHRNPLLYFTLWLLFHLEKYPPHFCSDGLLSVKRGWRAPEMRVLAARAELSQAQVTVQFGARVILALRK